jgi:uncharacterized protein
MKQTASFFWQKLDQPGHDSCRLFKLANGWRLSGAAVFWDAGRPCHFQYEVAVDATWRTRSASVSGYLGSKPVQLRIRSARNGGWRVGTELQENIAGCVDVDLGFTPATNLIPLRRLSLRVGESAEAPAAYLEFPRMRWVNLPQSYRRISRRAYEYESPTAGYAGTLEVSPIGAIIHYPGLFTAWSGQS